MSTKEVNGFDFDAYMEDVAELDLARDPYAWALYAFPWGEGELKDFDGPDIWQTKVLTYLRDRLQAGDMNAGQAVDMVIRLAVASGHGIGKSALVAIIVFWALSTFEDTKGIITANTDTQLRTKTGAELAKWHRLCIVADAMFTMTATSIFSKIPGHEKTWRVDMIPWSESNPEAFAGLHNKGKRILIIFDEASKIADAIWTVTEGALTDEDTEIIWCAFGNPTRNTGSFRECFRKYRHRWYTLNIDGRTARTTNKTQAAAWIEDYGIDSDFVKVRVLGQFPNTSDMQFIPGSYVDRARGRHYDKHQYDFAPVIITCDPSWTGTDDLIIAKRQGLAFTILKVIPKNDDDNVPAGYIAEAEDKYKADGVIIDQGYGTGIYSAGKAMGRDWILVNFGGASMRADCSLKRDEMWYLAREWLKEGGAIPDDQQLCDDLIGPEYVVKLNGKIKLESKDDMKARGVPSPNKADALVLSFAVPIVKKERTGSGMHWANGVQQEEYDIFR